MSATPTRIAGLALAWIALSAAASATAQQRPLTGQMLAEPATPAAPAAPAAPPAPLKEAPAVLALPARAQVGDTTRALLRLQASGERAGTPQPILGDQATASYKRYLDSFTHPIPAYLKTSVRRDVSSSGGGE